jgi:Ca2+-binding RTX toxin-like protein
MTKFTKGLVVQGDAGDDILRTLYKYEDNELHLYNVVMAGDGSDIIRSNDLVAKETGSALYGEGGDDYIFDSKARDTLSGGDGDDFISSVVDHGVQGQNDKFDFIDGGDGFDTLKFSGRIDAKSVGFEKIIVGGLVNLTGLDLSSVTEIAAAGPSATIQLGSAHDMSHITFDDVIGSYKLQGSNGDDRLDMSGNGSAFQFDGKEGNDYLRSNDVDADIWGGSGNDTLVGGDGDDVIGGETGSDLIRADSGDDKLIVNNDGDEAHGGNGSDMFVVNFTAKSGNVALYGDAGDDRFDIGKLTRKTELVVQGGGGYDSLAASGNLSGVVGNVDKLVFKGDLIVATEFLGTITDLQISRDPMTVRGHITLSDGGELTWRGSEQNVDLYGSNQDTEYDMRRVTNQTRIFAGKGDDTILSGSGGSLVLGDDGDDTFISGKGNDSFFGEDGRDVFVVRSILGKDEFNMDTSGSDHDLIDLSHVKGIDDFTDLKRHLTGPVNDLSIDFGDGNQLHIGAANDLLQAKHFIF